MTFLLLHLLSLQSLRRGEITKEIIAMLEKIILAIISLNLDVIHSAEMARAELCGSVPWDAAYWNEAANDVQTLADLASPIMGLCGC